MTLTLVCCKKFTNLNSYNIHIGETFVIYVPESSCCINCWINQENLKSIKYLGQKLEQLADKDCDGCTSYYSWTFKGTSIGSDTIKIVNISAGQKCSDFETEINKIQPEKFIVNVSR